MPSSLLCPGLLAATLLFVPMGRFDAAPAGYPSSASRACETVELQGEVNEGQQWKQPIGRGLTFALVPIDPSGKGYTGWDLAISRDGMYPDALLLATPPYASPNEREIGTTYGLRAQDAVAWTPRRFNFLLNQEDLLRARGLYDVLMNPKADSSTRQHKSNELLALVGMHNRVATGELTILDAKLTSGIEDPPAFAAAWAANFHRVPHTVVPGAPTPRGALRSLRFQITLWLPSEWQLPSTLHPKPAKCTE